MAYVQLRPLKVCVPETHMSADTTLAMASTETSSAWDNIVIAVSMQGCESEEQVEEMDGEGSDDLCEKDHDYIYKHFSTLLASAFFPDGSRLCLDNL